MASMRMVWKSVFGVMALTVVAAGSTALAQTPAPPPAASVPSEPETDMTSDLELSRAAIQLRRQAIVTASMDLEPKEAEAFWPLYREYRWAMMTVNDRLAKLINEFLSQHARLTDETATRMLDEYNAIERDRTGVKARYVPRFRAVMPPTKVARFFQVEHKLDAVINAELAQLIPLAR
jgi:hypothetical protein